MSVLTFHGANRVLQREIPVEAVKQISDQSEVLRRAEKIVSPIINGKTLKFRYGGRQFEANSAGIRMMMKVGEIEFVVGLDGQRKTPIIVTAWATRVTTH